MFLTPALQNMIRNDIAQLLNGLDSVDVTLRWLEGGGDADSVYGDRSGESEQTAVVRGMIVFPVGGMLLYRARDLAKTRFGDVQAEDAIFLLHSEAPLKDKRDLHLDVTGLGSFKMLTEPPLDVGQYALMFPDNEPFVQWVYARVEK